MTEVVQSQRLSDLEAVIERGMTTFVEVGTALAEIRDAKLYKATHSDFDAYCRERFGFSRIHAHRMMEAASVVEMLPVGNTPAPATERQARELAAIPDPVERAVVWQAAVNEHGPKITAEKVRETAQVLETLRAEPDGTALIEEVKTGNWDVAEAKKELTHRGVEWNRDRAEQRRREIESQRESDDLILSAASADDLEELDRARLRLAYSRGVKHLSMLVQLRPECLAAVLKSNDLPLLQITIRDTRQWMDAVEEAVKPRGFRVVS